MTSAIMLEHVLKAMNQSGRTNLLISELVIELTVIQKTKGGRKAAKEVVDSARNRSIIEIKTISGESNCAYRGVIVLYACHCPEQFALLKPTDEQLVQINYRSQHKTELNKGIISKDEIQKIKKGNKYKL